MSFLAPWALLWLGSIPVLLWLWRLASTHRQIRIPSLVPFERLLRRAPKRRTRLIIAPLFWFQLAALVGLAGALARPVVSQRRAKTVLVVLDTSASMGAEVGGSTVFAQAKRALLARIARKHPAEQWFLMTTSPPTPLTQQPTSDGVALTRAVEETRVSHLGGNLSTAAHLGRVLLGEETDATLVVTDEAPPTDALDTRLRWVRVGAAVPNVGIVGLDAQGPLCSVADASIVVTIQNFSDNPQAVTVAASQQGRRLIEARAELAPRDRRSLSLAIPNTTGLVDITLAAPNDSLEVDNRAWVTLRRAATLPIAVRSDSAPFNDTLSTWLGACEALRWSMDPASREAPSLVITDREADVPASAVASVVFDAPSEARPVLSHWVVSSGHPIGSYLAPVEAVAAALNLSPSGGISGTPVVSALVSGRNIPIVVADEREGHRAVLMRFEPSAGRASTPVLLAFFNSLRWLMGRSEGQATGEPLLVGGFRPGPVSVRRPDGTMDSVESDGGRLVYDQVTLAGPYRFSQGSAEVVEAVNFFDPLESNLLDHPSTWRAAQQPLAAPAVARNVVHPLSNLLMMVVLLLLLLEWWRYSTKSTVHSPPSTVVPK